MNRKYKDENESGLDENDNDAYYQEPMVNAGELKNLSNQIEHLCQWWSLRKRKQTNAWLGLNKPY